MLVHITVQQHIKAVEIIGLSHLVEIVDTSYILWVTDSEELTIQLP